MKFGKFDDYPPRSLESAEAALLTAWRSLERYHEESELHHMLSAILNHAFKGEP